MRWGVAPGMYGEEARECAEHTTAKNWLTPNIKCVRDCQRSVFQTGAL